MMRALLPEAQDGWPARSERDVAPDVALDVAPLAMPKPGRAGTHCRRERMWHGATSRNATSRNGVTHSLRDMNRIVVGGFGGWRPSGRVVAVMVRFMKG